ENCPDLRNTKVVDLITELEEYNPNIDIYDPWVNADEAKKEYGLTLKAKLTNNYYDAVIGAVAHNEFKEFGAKGIRDLCKDTSVIFDIKYILDATAVDGRL
ncbi:MAG: Vi polysaccharide biosynthesis UDP-N-acetylglucosamine C-6 dehydrogenase TviB, partial [Gammaproteobacteria bacterium]|nr:Vi polysaccharide biosynthesis UDP-N-acetylglucosamine C-6 dehydrogenase TviB [Gammaproteobacteria bacterium]